METESVNCNKKGWVVLTGSTAEAGQRRRRRGEESRRATQQTVAAAAAAVAAAGDWYQGSGTATWSSQPASLQQHWTHWTHWAKMAASLHCTQWTPQQSNIYSIPIQFPQEWSCKDGRVQSVLLHIPAYHTNMPRCITLNDRLGHINGFS